MGMRRVAALGSLGHRIVSTPSFKSAVTAVLSMGSGSWNDRWNEPWPRSMRWILLAGDRPFVAGRRTA